MIEPSTSGIVPEIGTQIEISTSEVCAYSAVIPEATSSKNAQALQRVLSKHDSLFSLGQMTPKAKKPKPKATNCISSPEYREFFGQKKTVSSVQETPEAVAGVLQDHIYWPGQITSKKRKLPKIRQPSWASAAQYKKCQEPESCNKRGSKKGSEWVCMYCKSTYTHDLKEGWSRKWINCDDCPNKMHISCIPIKHKQRINWEEQGSDSEVDFLCELCLPHSSSDLSDYLVNES